MGFEIKLIPPQHVKPFVGYQKMMPVGNLSQHLGLMSMVSQLKIKIQYIKSIICIRQRRVDQQLAAANQLKGLASEYGVIIAKSFKCLKEQVPIDLEDPDNELSIVLRRMHHGLLTKMNTLTDQIKPLTLDLKAYTTAS